MNILWSMYSRGLDYGWYKANSQMIFKSQYRLKFKSEEKLQVIKEDTINKRNK